MDCEQSFEFPSIPSQKEVMSDWDSTFRTTSWLTEEENPSFQRLHRLSNNFDRVEFSFKDTEEELENESKSSFLNFDFTNLTKREMKNKSKKTQIAMKKTTDVFKTAASSVEMNKGQKVVFGTTPALSTKAPSEKGEISATISVVDDCEEVHFKTAYSHKTLEDLNSFIEKAKKMKLRTEEISTHRSIRTKKSRMRKIISKKSKKSTGKSKGKIINRKNKFGHVNKLLKKVHRMVKRSQKLSFVGGISMASILLLHEKTNKLIEE